jgi:outer membrane lipoprotein-sorting protein
MIRGATITSLLGAHARALLWSLLLPFANAWGAPTTPAPGPPDADAILRRAFEQYRARSSESSVAMSVHRPEWERHLQMRVWTRGEDDALVRFVAPPKDAGNATLKVGESIWVFNPRLNQVIKLPVSMMSQSWMGSDFSYNDLSKSEELLEWYTHRLTGTEQSAGHTVWTIESLPREGAPVVWGKVTIKIRDDEVLSEETFFDQDLKPVRHMQTEKVGPLGGRPYPLVMTMHPIDSPGQWTRIETLEGQFDRQLPEYLFTLSNLQYPRE